MDEKMIIKAFNSCIDCIKQCKEAKDELESLGITITYDTVTFGKVEITLRNGIDQLGEMLGKEVKETNEWLTGHEKTFRHKGAIIKQSPVKVEDSYLPIREKENA